jgi:hypothetical protein
MEIAEMGEALEQLRKIFGFFTDAAVWADLFHKEVGGKVVPNAQQLPGYVKNRQHVAKFGQAMAEVEKKQSNARTAILDHWMASPRMHPIQSDDVVVSIAAMADCDMTAAVNALLQIAKITDPEPGNPDQSRDAVLLRINNERDRVAESLQLIKRPVEMYAQYHIDKIKGGVLGSGAQAIAYLQKNWPIIEKLLVARTASINKAIDRPAGPGDPGGLRARLQAKKLQLRDDYRAAKQ